MIINGTIYYKSGTTTILTKFFSNLFFQLLLFISIPRSFHKCSLFFKAGAVNQNIFKGQASNENEATGLSGEHGKQEAYTCSVFKETSIAQFKQIILQKCISTITRLSNFLDVKNQYFYSKFTIFKRQQLIKKISSTAEQTKLIWPECF